MEHSEFIPQDLADGLVSIGYDYPSVKENEILFQQAFRFFRERFNIHVSSNLTYDNKFFFNRLIEMTKYGYQNRTNFCKEYEDMVYGVTVTPTTYETIGESEIASIRYVINIIKTEYKKGKRRK